MCTIYGFSLFPALRNKFDCRVRTAGCSGSHVCGVYRAVIGTYICSFTLYPRYDSIALYTLIQSERGNIFRLSLTLFIRTYNSSFHPLIPYFQALTIYPPNN